jgi:chemotaxis protein CheZ
MDLLWECVNVSNLSDGPDALDELDALVRRLGATLGELGWDVALRQLADELPDARDRLAYVGRMTEAAAMKVLNMVDAAQPVCQAAASEALALADRLDSVGRHADLGVGEARAALAEATAALRHQAGLQKSQNSVLTDIMLAQDFQDLSGQVIKKVVLIIGHAEQQLQQMLAQSEGRVQVLTAVENDQLAGPQAPDKAVAQEDVDDLLASLGF